MIGGVSDKHTLHRSGVELGRLVSARDVCKRYTSKHSQLLDRILVSVPFREGDAPSDSSAGRDVHHDLGRHESFAPERRRASDRSVVLRGGASDFSSTVFTPAPRASL